MAKTKQVCTRCGFVSTGTTRVKGSILIEIMLWFFFLIPGLIYSLWRLTTKAVVCPKCGSEELVPSDTPRGRELTTGQSPKV